MQTEQYGSQTQRRSDENSSRGVSLLHSPPNDDEAWETGGFTPQAAGWLLLAVVFVPGRPSVVQRTVQRTYGHVVSTRGTPGGTLGLKREQNSTGTVRYRYRTPQG